MIHELNKSLMNLILVESKENKSNYLLLGGDETKRWVNTILYSLKKGVLKPLFFIILTIWW
jgi:hypothetical protein